MLQKNLAGCLAREKLSKQSLLPRDEACPEPKDTRSAARNRAEHLHIVREDGLSSKSFAQQHTPMGNPPRKALLLVHQRCGDCELATSSLWGAARPSCVGTPSCYAA